MSFCVQAFKDLLKQNSGDQRNDNEILNLLLEIFRAHKRLKTESPFSGAMIDAYKTYAEGKVWLQENINYTDNANKFCNLLTNALKNQEKQQQITGQKQTLEELGLKNLNATLPKINTTFPSATASGNLTPTGGKSPVVTIKAVTSTPVPVITPTITTITTTCSTSISTTTTTSMATMTPIGSRPRGRPPGSKNSTTKSDASKNAAMHQKRMSSMMQPFAGAAPSLDLITADMDPATKARFIALLADPKLLEDFNSQLMLNYLANALQPQTSMTNMMPTQMKVPKVEKPPTVPKSSAMSIFPTANKPHPALSTSPLKASCSTSIAATITPVSSSPSLLKTSGSTVISVGSGQLTITPSISITPNPNPTKLTSVLPQMPAPSFNLQKPTQPKVRRSTGEKPSKANQKAQRLSYPVMPPIAVEHLPKSLSIIPSPGTFVPPKQSIIPPMNVDIFANKPVKQPKPKKKSIDANVTAQLKKTIPQIPGIDPNRINKSLTNPHLQAQLNSMSNYNFLSHFEQFLTGGVPQASLQLQKPVKSKATVTSAPTQKPAIKVKQLDQLQARNPPKVSEKSAKGKQQAIPTPNMINVKNAPISRSPTVLNAFGTTISSIAHPISALSTTFPSLPTVASSLPANLQIR